MAERAPLKADRIGAPGRPTGRTGRRALPLIVATVLALHLLALDRLAQALEGSRSQLRPMAAPLFTRMLQPQTPAIIAPATATPPPRDRTVFTAAAPRPVHAASSAASLQPSQARQSPQTPDAMADPAAHAVGSSSGDGGDEASAASVAMQTQVAQAPAPPPSTPPSSATSPSAAEPAPLASTLTAAAAASAPQAQAQDHWPPDTRVSYRLGGQARGGELYGDARVQWQRDGARYQVQLDIDITLLARLVMTSQGEFTADELRPQTFEETRRSRVRSVRIEPHGVVLANGRVLPRPEGVQDTASQFVELAHRFATGRQPLRIGETVQLWLARPGGVDLWTYDVVGMEPLPTPKLGTVEAYHLKPRPLAQARGNITAEMWFAPSLNYLPVRVRVSMGEEAHVDLLVDRIEQR